MKLGLDLLQSTYCPWTIIWALYALFNNASYLLIPALSIFIPSIIALVWITFKQCAGRESSASWTSQMINLKTFSIVYIISICTLMVYHSRTLAYFIFISLLFGILAIQILSATERTPILLLQIVLLSINIVLGTIYTYPYYYSGGDTFVHVYYAQITSLLENTIPVSLDPAYAFYPCYHILIASLSLLSNVDVKAAIFIVGPLISLLLIPVIYLLTNEIFSNPKIALLSCLVYAVTPTIVYYLSYPVARSADFLFFISFLFILIRVSKSRMAVDNTSNNLLLILFSIAIVLFHSVSIVQFMVILIILGILERAFRLDRYMHVYPILFLGTIFVSYLLYVATIFNQGILQYIINVQQTDAVEAIIQPFELNYTVFFLDHLFMSVTLIFALIGINVYLKQKNYFSTMAILSFFLLLFYIPNPIKNNEVILTHLGFYRFELFAVPFIAMMIATGIMCVTTGLKRKKIPSKRQIRVIFILITVVAFSSLISTNNATDINKHTSSRYFTDQDMHLIHFIEAKTPQNSSIFSDYFMSRYFSHKESLPELEKESIKFYNSDMVNKLSMLDINAGYTILRLKEYEERGKLLFGTYSNVYDYQKTPQNIDEIKAVSTRLTKIYGDGAIDTFYN